jgi:CheY-like chemotaxis protein
MLLAALLHRFPGMTRWTEWNASLAGVHVLVVAGDRRALELLTTVLRYCDAAVTPAGSAAEALRRLEDVLPHVVVADVERASDQYVAFVRDLRQRSAARGGRVPAVALAPRDEGIGRAHAFAAGFQEHLPKPITPWALCRAVAGLAQPATL